MSLALEIPDGPGALNGLSFISVLTMCSVLKVGNCKLFAFGGFSSMNWCLFCIRGFSAGKNMSASLSAFSLLDEVYVPMGLLRSSTFWCL